MSLVLEYFAYAGAIGAVFLAGVFLFDRKTAKHDTTASDAGATEGDMRNFRLRPRRPDPDNY